MGAILFSVTTFFLSLAILASCERINHEFIYPNHTSSYFQFIDANGVFLRSRNGTFNAAFFNPGRQQSKYYLCILHSASQTVIWSANRDSPFSKSIRLFLSPQGIAVTDKISSGAATVKWSTPPLNSSVAAMQLTETGNLALLDQFNRSIWQSFDHPTDTIVIGQQLPVGKSLVSSLSDSDYSSGDFQFSVDTYDGLLEWKGSNYWKISMEQNAFVNSNAPISFMALNGTGLYFYGENGSVVVLQVILSPSEFRIAKLGFGGQFTISSFSFRSTTYEFMAPKDICRIPYICGSIGLCTTVTSSGQYSCSCPSGFQNINQGCFPSDASLSLPSACNGTGSVQSSTVSYTSLGTGVSYFQIFFSEPTIKFVNLSYCQSLCSNCSCLGFFYSNYSNSCLLLENQLGSLISTTTSYGYSLPLGYIKVMAKPSATNLQTIVHKVSQWFSLCFSFLQSQLQFSLRFLYGCFPYN